MQKQKEYNIADTNLANFGTELEKNVKTAAALSDPEWKALSDATPTVGLKIWRIEKFAVVAVDKADYGSFFSGDSYIVLKTSKQQDKFIYDVHFWLGAETTQDEAGTAAYKTVELDDVLGGAPVQHREVEGHESHLFLRYFKKHGLRILDGGIESGFHHVEPEKYRPRLLHIKGKKYVRVVEVDISYKSLNSGDVFVLDKGLDLYQWQGKDCGMMERAKAAQLVRAIDDDRKGLAEIHVVDETETGEDAKVFWEQLGGHGEIAPAHEQDDEDWEKEGQHKLFRIKEVDGGEEFTLEHEGPVKESQLDSDDAFLLDVGCELIVWVGKNASKHERRIGLKIAQDYLHQNKRPIWLPISRVLEGGENEIFKSYLHGEGRNF